MQMLFMNNLKNEIATDGTGDSSGGVGSPIPVRAGEVLPNNPPASAPVIPPAGGPAPVNPPVPVIPPGSIQSYDTSKVDKYTLGAIKDSLNSTDNLFTNSNGDIVNEQGAVVLSKDKLAIDVTTHTAKYLQTVESYVNSLDTFVLTLNGVDTDCKFDATNTNVVDGTGKIIMTRADFVKQVADTNSLEDLTKPVVNALPEDFINQVIKLSGFDAVDDAGNPISFPSTPEGIAKYVAHVAESSATTLANDKLNDFIDRYNLGDAINYATIKGSLDGYTANKSYTALTINPSNKAEMRNLVVEAELKRGRSTTEAESVANAFEASNILESMASASLSYLQNEQSKFETARRDAAQDELNRQADQKARFANEVANIIARGTIMNFNIPETIKLVDSNNIIRNAPKQSFVDYVTKPVYGQYTLNDIETSKETTDQKLLLSFIRFTGYSLDQLVQGLASNLKVSQFRATKQHIQLGSASNNNNNNNGSNAPISPVSRFNR